MNCFLFIGTRDFFQEKRYFKASFSSGQISPPIPSPPFKVQSVIRSWVVIFFPPRAAITDGRFDKRFRFHSS